MFPILEMYTLGLVLCCFIFFFSSRRRHTRYIGDWSSDVCSSDLLTGKSSYCLGPPYSSVFQNSTLGCEGDKPIGSRPGAQGAVAQRGEDWRREERSEERRVGKEGRWGGWAGDW